MSRKNLFLGVALVSVLALFSSTALAQYKLTNLDSNQVRGAKNDDPLQVNGWGMARSATSPWWVSDQGSGWSTLYDGMGTKQSLVVAVPPAAKLFVGQPTGIVWNGSKDFAVNGAAANFIFDTLDGTISAWSPAANLKSAIVIADNSANGASYTGLAITNKASGNSLFAVDNANNRIDIYDATFTWKGSFAADPGVPAGMAAFGIQDINGVVFVSWAPTNEGPGGYINMYKEDGTLIGPFTQDKHLNQPWGFAVAPPNFGRLKNALLISNNNDHGTIVAYDALGRFVGYLRDEQDRPIVIDQLWAIGFGGGNTSNGPTNALYFTAGPANNLAGTFGMIVPKHFK
ncbi:MAG TPA: TIGR03118 family protein [Terriglobales bacterium]|nr:TIGR03118 family protein [Terriglobales bacterium]